MELVRLAGKLADIQESLETLASGEAGMLDEGTTAEHITMFLDAIYNMTSFLEDELGNRLTKVADSEVEDMVQNWLDTAAKVDARRGEVS